MSLAEGSYPPSPLCPLFDNGTRFGCAIANPWYNETLRAAATLDVMRFRNAFGHTAMYFVGDSFSEQHARDTACTLRAWHPSSTRIPAAKCYRAVTREDTADSELGGIGRVCYVQAAKGYADRSTRAAYRDMQASGELRPDSVVIVNEGVWFRVERDLPPNATAAGGSGGGSGADETVVEVARASAWHDVLLDKEMTLVWRETAAQHFHTARGTGMWPGRAGLTNERLPKYKCEPIQKDEQARRVAEVNQALPPFMHVLPLFGASLDGWRSHIERHTPHGRSTRGRDCTHYCEPSPLFEGANAALLNLVRGDGMGGSDGLSVRGWPPSGPPTLLPTSPAPSAA